MIFAQLRSRLAGPWARLRPHAGTLLLVPLAAMLLPGQFNLPLPTLMPSRLTVVDPHRERAARGPIALFSVEEEGVHWERGRKLWASEKLALTLPPLPARAVIRLQGDANDAYLVEARAGKEWTEVWRAPALDDQRGLATRVSPVVNLPAGAALRIRPVGGDSSYAVGWFSVAPIVSFSLLHLAGLLWLAWLLLLAMERSAPGRKLAAPVLRAWAAADSPLTALLGALAIFRASLLTVAVLAAAALFWLGSRLLKKAPLGAAVLAVSCCLLYFLVLSPVVKRVVKGEVQRLQVLDLEHRLRPHSEPDINADGIRFKGEAKDLRAGDFNVLFLGDSFTFGWRLPYEATYPAQFERLLAKGRCRQRVRAINFGWPGASPILAHRLLRQIGGRYKPDLILYNLDMSDFRDDLLYEQNLARAGEKLTPDVPALLWYAARHGLTRLLGGSPPVARLQAELRQADRTMAPGRRFPEARFFPLIGPLNETRAYLERGTMRHLKTLESHGRQVLGAPMAVLVLPRACQYSDREVPNNWEHDCPVKGPYVKEPNRYLAGKKESLGYPLFDLLPGFEASSAFPLYLKDDPHWNARGATLAATLAAEALIGAGLLPCEAAARQAEAQP